MNAREAFEELEKNFRIIEEEIDESPFNEDTRIMAINRTLPIIKRVIDRLEEIEKRAKQVTLSYGIDILNKENTAGEFARTHREKDFIEAIHYIINGEEKGESK